MSTATNKRKRHSFSDSNPTAESRAAPPTAPSTGQKGRPRTQHGSNATERHLGDQHPQQLHGRRSNLQRGAKDKVYAERLAAAGDSVAGFNGGFVRGGGAAIDDRKRCAKGKKNNQASRNKTREEIPLGWPFTDPSVVNARKTVSNKSRGSSISQRLATVSKTQKKSLDEDGAPVSVQKQEQDSCSGSAETCQKVCSSGKALENQCRTETDTCSIGSKNNSRIDPVCKQKTKPNKPKSNRKKGSKWACSKCTFDNSSRRKKCEVCGHARELSMGTDETFALSGASDESNVASSEAHLEAELDDNNKLSPPDEQENGALAMAEKVGPDTPSPVDSVKANRMAANELSAVAQNEVHESQSRSFTYEPCGSFTYQPSSSDEEESGALDDEEDITKTTFWMVMNQPMITEPKKSKSKRGQETNSGSGDRKHSLGSTTQVPDNQTNESESDSEKPSIAFMLLNPEWATESKKPKSKRRKTSEWKCPRCTIRNSNDRWKCEICGTVRESSTSSGGTSALSSVSKECSRDGLETTNFETDLLDEPKSMCPQNEHQNGPTVESLDPATNPQTDMANESSSLTQRKNYSLSSSSVEGHDSGTSDKEFSSGSTPASMETEAVTISSDSNRKSDNIKQSCKQQESTTKPKKSKSKRKKASKWTCPRCTFDNSSRRKKCEICGTVRDLSMSSDETLVLTDAMNECNVPGVVATYLQAAPFKESNAMGKGGSQLNNTNVSTTNEQENGAPAMPENVAPETLSPTDILAIVSKPVSARSKFKRLRLSQGMSQHEDERLQQSPSSSSGDAHKCSDITVGAGSTSEAGTSEQSQAENFPSNIQSEVPKSSNNQPTGAGKLSEFRDMINKRRSARRDKRRAKRAKTKARSSRSFRDVKVCVVVGGAELNDGDDCCSGSLIASVQSSRSFKDVKVRLVVGGSELNDGNASCFGGLIASVSSGLLCQVDKRLCQVASGMADPKFVCKVHNVPAVRRRCSDGVYKDKRFYVCGLGDDPNRNLAVEPSSDDDQTRAILKPIQTELAKRLDDSKEHSSTEVMKNCISDRHDPFPLLDTPNSNISDHVDSPPPEEFSDGIERNPSFSDQNEACLNESIAESQVADDVRKDALLLVATKNLHCAIEKACSTENDDAKQKARSTEEGTAKDIAEQNVLENDNAQYAKCVGINSETARISIENDIVVDSGVATGETSPRDRSQSRLAAKGEPCNLSCLDTTCQQVQTTSNPSAAAKDKHAHKEDHGLFIVSGSRENIVPTPNCDRKSGRGCGHYIETCYIPMTQETSQFDYYSQDYECSDKSLQKIEQNSFHIDGIKGSCSASKIEAPSASTLKYIPKANEATFHSTGKKCKPTFTRTVPKPDAQAANTEQIYQPPSTSSASSLPMFQTAGKKTAIRVSDESLSKVNKLFYDDLDGDEFSGPPNEVSTARRSAITNVNKPSSHSANSKRSVAAAVRPVHQPPSTSSASSLPMFQTAGKKTAIKVSDESLSKVNKLFYDDLDDDEFSGPPNEASGYAPFASSIAMANVDASTPALDGSILKQNPYRSRNSNKVRFSLDAKDFKAVEPKSTEEVSGTAFGESDSSKITLSLGTLSASSKKPILDSEVIGAKMMCLPQGEDTLSLVTPDRRQSHRLQENVDQSCQMKSSAQLPGDNGTISSRLNKAFDTKCSPTLPFCKGSSQSNPYPTKRKLNTTLVDTNDRLPLNNNMYTPLHNGSTGFELQSEIKSKRLFHGTTVDASTPFVASTPKSPKRMRWSLEENSKLHSKVKLDHFPISQKTRTRCTNNGVSSITLKVTSTNANMLRFGLNDGLPLFFWGQRETPKCSHVGKVSEIRSWLIEQNCDESLFTDKWIQNHHRWIVWKLAAMERCLPEELGGQYLVYNHVLKQMKERYEKELRCAKRPAVRKILNRDVSACVPIILCVSQILRFRSKDSKTGTTKEEIRLELTDGWYALPAGLDTVLLQFIDGGKIKVGSKLMICNGQLLGSDDGVDPLDDSYSSSKRDCPVCLSISANSTRLARWDAKLGFVSPNNPQLHGGTSLLVTSLGDVFASGGPVPAIDLVVCKRYPRMFLEQADGPGRQEGSLHLTEAEDAARQIEHDTRYQRTSEEFADKAQKECSEELDEDAPTQWKEMNHSNNPSEYYDKLDATDKKTVDEWVNKRGILLQSMISKSVADYMKDDPATERTSRAYVKLLVQAYSSRDALRSAPLTAELTIWRVSDEQYDLVREGSIVRMKNLVPKTGALRGLLQLSGNQETPMEALSKQPTHEQLLRLGYKLRSPKSLVHINLMSKHQARIANSLENEVDVVACVVKIYKNGANSTIVYLTDESGLVFKINRDHKVDNKDPFSLGNTTLPVAAAFCNIGISSFDTDEFCALGTWGLLSCKNSRTVQTRINALNSWCATEDGVKCCNTVLDKINAHIPCGTDDTVKSKVCFGYILRFEGEHCTKYVSFTNAIIDHGGKELVNARFPTHSLQQVIHLFQTDSNVNITRVTDLASLNYLMRSNQMLLRFLLAEMPCYGGGSPVLEVTDVSVAKVNELARLHQS